MVMKDGLRHDTGSFVFPNGVSTFSKGSIIVLHYSETISPPQSSLPINILLKLNLPIIK